MKQHVQDLDRSTKSKNVGSLQDSQSRFDWHPSRTLVSSSDTGSSCILWNIELADHCSGCCNHVPQVSKADAPHPQHSDRERGCSHKASDMQALLSACLDGTMSDEVTSIVQPAS